MKFPRQSGILLHITSLPGKFGSGDLGPDAFRFVDWLAESDQRLWQILPLGGLGPGFSPYMSPSAIAGNEMLISIEQLAVDGLIAEEALASAGVFEDAKVDFTRSHGLRREMLQLASSNFQHSRSNELRADYEVFCEANKEWLDDYALFMVISEAHGGIAWNEWPADLASRDPDAIATFQEQNAEKIAFWCFCQWQFQSQWQRLRAYANSKGIKIVGDVPIFVAENSVDVWANPTLFKLDDQGKPTHVAGVPPDYFSETGQRWGNPLYNWPTHEAEGFSWWIGRIKHALTCVDILRIDHFRAFVDYWEIPAASETAINGRWVASPGRALFNALYQDMGALPLVAEDLGDISDDVIELRKSFDIPGMAVLQFAWDGNGENAFLPHRHQNDLVVYTGTHDNDTTAGWWASSSDAIKHQVRTYFSSDGSDIVHQFIRAIMHSAADQAIFPMQDVLELGTSARLNTPGKLDDNWSWRFQWSDVHDHHKEFLRNVTRESGRAVLADCEV